MAEPKMLHVSENLDHLKPFEDAARRYCKKAGLNPDEKLPSPHPVIAGEILWIDRWRFAAEELLDLSMRLTAMREAKEAADKKVVH